MRPGIAVECCPGVRTWAAILRVNEPGFQRLLNFDLRSELFSDSVYQIRRQMRFQVSAKRKLIEARLRRFTRSAGRYAPNPHNCRLESILFSCRLIPLHAVIGRALEKLSYNCCNSNSL